MSKISLHLARERFHFEFISVSEYVSSHHVASHHVALHRAQMTASDSLRLFPISFDCLTRILLDIDGDCPRAEFARSPRVFLGSNWLQQRLPQRHTTVQIVNLHSELARSILHISSRRFMHVCLSVHMSVHLSIHYTVKPL